MKRLSADYRRFLDLLRFALDDSADALPEGFAAPSAKEWQLFYGISRIHNMTGWLYRAAEKLNPALKTDLPETVKEHLRADAHTIRSAHSIHTAIIEKQKEAWAESDIDAHVIKGLETAKYYPVPELRTLGDIDWWIEKPEDWERAIKVAESNGCKVSLDSDGDVNYIIYGVVVEHHHNGLAAAGSEGELHLLCRHVLHHAQVAGLDLRQMYDYAVARRATQGTLDRELYNKLIKRGRLVRWTAVLDNLSDFLLQNGAKLSHDAEKLLVFALEGSNFFTRTFYFSRLAPVKYANRLCKLSFGRTKRLIISK